MTLLIIGLSLSLMAIGVLYYLNNQLKKRLERNNKALLAFQNEFTQYQVVGHIEFARPLDKK